MIKPEGLFKDERLPILQDGRLIGAITHVFVNDPTKGLCDICRKYA